MPPPCFYCGHDDCFGGCEQSKRIASTPKDKFQALYAEIKKHFDFQCGCADRINCFYEVLEASDRLEEE
jgi:hypothetical protein